MNERKSVFDGLRFYMILIICVGHLSACFFGNTCIAPNVAVDYFFVLSGFGLAYNNKQVRENAIMFAMGKVKKTYKLYLISMYSMIPLKFITDVVLRDNHIKELCFLVIKIIMAPFMIQSIFGYVGVTHILNGVCWFFSCLFICYITYPFFRKMNKFIEGDIKKTILFILIYLGIIYILHYTFGRIENCSVFDDLAYGNPIVRCWYFGLGTLTGNFFLHNKELLNTYSDKIPIDIFNLLEIVLIFGIPIYSLYRHSVYCILPLEMKEMVDLLIVLTSLIIFYIGRGRCSKLFSNRLHSYLGRCSMIIYFGITLLFYMWISLFVAFLESIQKCRLA